MPSLALIFHLIDVVSGKAEFSENEISESAANLAEKWCLFLEEHARKIYALASSTTQEIISAHEMHKKILSGEIRSNMTIRDIYRTQWKNLKNKLEVEAAVSVLEEYDYLQVEKKNMNGNVSAIIRLHPSLKENTTLVSSVSEFSDLETEIVEAKI